MKIGGDKPDPSAVAKESKKKAVTESIERLEPELVESKLSGLLSKDNQDAANGGEDG